MEDYLKILLASGEKMRDLQKKYFAEKDKDQRRSLLIQSKQAEKEFDTAINNIKQLWK